MHHCITISEQDTIPVNPSLQLFQRLWFVNVQVERGLLWLQIQVQFSSYLARVVNLAKGPPTSAGTAEGSQARLESLQEALARIDAFGAMAAGAIDEAQVTHDPRASISALMCHGWDGGLPQYGM